MITTNQLRKIARGWKIQANVFPCAVEVQDRRPNQFCDSRWVVVLTHAQPVKRKGFQGHLYLTFGDMFICEQDTERQAKAYARRLESRLDKVWEEVVAEVEAERAAEGV